MSFNLKELSRKDRILVVLSAVWFLLSLLFSLMIAEEEYYEIYEFFALFLFLLLPVGGYWSLRWIRNADDSDKKSNKVIVSKLNEFKNAPSLLLLRGQAKIDKHVFWLILLASIFVLAWILDIALVESIRTEVRQVGLKNVPATFYENVDFYSSLCVGLRIVVLLAFMGVFLDAYSKVKKSVSNAGVQGLECSGRMLFVWFILPLMNIIMPWRVLGSLDRATTFVTRYEVGGAIWNEKGNRGFSWKSFCLGFLFIFTGFVSKVAQNEIQHVTKKFSTAKYGYFGLLNQIQTISIVNLAAFFLFLSCSVFFWWSLNKKIKTLPYD